MPRGPRLPWDSILARAAEIVRSYDTGVTLRQLYYRLVSEHLIPNTKPTYNSLSARTAEARRDGWFPALVDRGREIHGGGGMSGPQDALNIIVRAYSLDRTIGQKVNLYIGVEKNGLLNLLLNWFGPFGVKVVALGGYASQTFKDEISEECLQDGRPAVFIYGGDFDPSGEDLLRDFLERTDCWERVHKIALLPEHIAEYDLPPLPGKASDSRAEGFIARHGELMQVELDALPPDVLQRLYRDQFDYYWDIDAYDDVLVQERRDRMMLRRIATRYEDVTSFLAQDEEEE